MLTVRLSSSDEKKLQQYCELENVSKSTVVKEAIELYLAQKKKIASPFSAGEDLFGLEGSGVQTNSKNYKKKVKKLISEKHSH